MDLGPSERVQALVAAVRRFLLDEIVPVEPAWEAEVARSGADERGRFTLSERQRAILGDLKTKARALGLWNFWLTDSTRGPGLSTVEYAYLAEVMGWSRLAAEVFNCSAPDTGNMEVLERFGTPAQKRRWLDDLRRAARARPT